MKFTVLNRLNKCVAESFRGFFIKFSWFKCFAVMAYTVALVTFIINYQNSVKQKNYQAWQLLNSSNGIQGIAGRTLALEDLIATGENLSYINLSGVKIEGLHLEKGVLIGANLQGAVLSYACLRNARLQGANADFSFLQWASLEGAQMDETSILSG